MTGFNQIDLAHRYFVSDIPGANIPATRLRNILDALQQGRQLSALALNYLQEQGLLALQQLARGETTYETFCETAGTEQARRQQAAEVDRVARDAARLIKEAEYEAAEAVRAASHERDRHRAEEARRARERDPKYIAKMKSQQLRMRYGLDQFIEVQAFPRVMDILHRLDGGSRLNDTDILWLTTEGKDYYTESLQAAFHDREAEFYAAEYRRTSDPWNAVNASGHYRKCGKARAAHDLLTSIPAQQQTTPKLKSAVCTTHGGVMRDLDRMDEALELGHRAHALTPRDFRPCTLLGAVNIELGNLSIGWDWYRKAEERGASERSIDYDLRGIFLRANDARRLEIRAFLLREDPTRYAWVDGFSPERPRARRT
jgi:hypothetical protein